MARKTRGALKPIPKQPPAEEAGKPQHYPVTIPLRYDAELNKMITQMLKEYRAELYPIGAEKSEMTMDASPAEKARAALRRLAERFERLFAKRAPELAEELLGGLNKSSQVSSGQSLKDTSANITLATKPFPPGMVPIITAGVKDNVSLIKSIPTKFHSQIEQAVISSVSPGGHGLKTITDTLMQYEGVTRRRAEFIALDQTRKLTAQMNAKRMEEAGARKFRWIHSGGGAEPRELHKYELNGKIFEYDNPPVIDERTGERGLPGQLPNCRCIAQPIIEFED